MGRVRAFVVSGIVLLLGRGRRRPPKQAERVVPELPPDRSAENAPLVLLFAAALFAAGFLVVYAADSLPDHTQLLGSALGLSLLCVAAAMIVVGKRLVVTGELVGAYPPGGD